MPWQPSLGRGLRVVHETSRQPQCERPEKFEPCPVAPAVFALFSATLYYVPTLNLLADELAA